MTKAQNTSDPPWRVAPPAYNAGPGLAATGDETYSPAHDLTIPKLDAGRFAGLHGANLMALSACRRRVWKQKLTAPPLNPKLTRTRTG